MTDSLATERDADKTVTTDLPPRAFPSPGERRDGHFQVVVRQSVLNEIFRHGAMTSDIEVCGVLVGEAARDEQGPFLYIEGSIRGEHASNLAAQVTFTAATWAHIDACMDQYPGKKIVGWYHTHPGFGIFLSAADRFIHDNFFNLPWQVAFVYDPLSHADGMFYWRAGTAVQEAFLVEPDIAAEHGEPPSAHANPAPAAATTPAEPCTGQRKRRPVRLLVAIALIGLLLALLWFWLLPDFATYFAAEDGDPSQLEPNQEHVAE